MPMADRHHQQEAQEPFYRIQTLVDATSPMNPHDGSGLTADDMYSCGWPARAGCARRRCARSHTQHADYSQACYFLEENTEAWQIYAYYFLY